MTRSPFARAAALAASGLIGTAVSAATLQPLPLRAPQDHIRQAPPVTRVQMNLGDALNQVIRQVEKDAGKVVREIEKGNIRLEDGKIRVTGDAAAMVRNITRQRSGEDRDRVAREVLSRRASEDRDLAAILSTVPAALLGQGQRASDLPEEELLTYRNCPPGLAKLDPPCVPPGLAKQGVTYEQWVSYGPQDYENMLDARRDGVSTLAPAVSRLPPEETVLASVNPTNRSGLPAAIQDDNARAALARSRTDSTQRSTTREDTAKVETTRKTEPAPEALARAEPKPQTATPKTNLLLTSEEIAELYNLRPAPAGRHYALIDGMPVLLDDKDYNSLSSINDLARAAPLGEGVQVAPTAALTQNELMATYKLSAPEPGYKYSVLNGEVIMVEDRAFETLQLIRIARAAL